VNKWTIPICLHHGWVTPYWLGYVYVFFSFYFCENPYKCHCLCYSMCIPTIVHNVIQFQTTIGVIHSNFKVSRLSLSYVSLFTNPNSNLMSRILAEHGNFNLLSSETRYGIQFYDLQFHIVVELGLHSLKLTKSSIPFRASKIIMKAKVNMSKAALLIELGWEPINDFLNRQRASYFFLYK